MLEKTFYSEYTKKAESPKMTPLLVVKNLLNLAEAKQEFAPEGEQSIFAEPTLKLEETYHISLNEPRSLTPTALYGISYGSLTKQQRNEYTQIKRLLARHRKLYKGGD